MNQRWILSQLEWYVSILFSNVVTFENEKWFLSRYFVCVDINGSVVLLNLLPNYNSFYDKAHCLALILPLLLQHKNYFNFDNILFLGLLAINNKYKWGQKTCQFSKKHLQIELAVVFLDWQLKIRSVIHLMRRCLKNTILKDNLQSEVFDYFLFTIEYCTWIFFFVSSR